MNARLALILLVPIFAAACAWAYLARQAYEPDLEWHARRLARALQDRDASLLSKVAAQDGVTSMQDLLNWHAQAMSGCGPGAVEEPLKEHLGTVKVVLVYTCSGGREVRLETEIDQGQETQVQVAGPALFSGLIAKYDLPPSNDRAKFWRALAAAYRKENAAFAKFWPTNGHYGSPTRTWLEIADNLEQRAAALEKTATPSAKTSSSSAPPASKPPR